MRFLFLLAFSILAPNYVFAQRDTSAHSIPAYAIKILPSGILDPLQAVYALGFEKRINQNFSWMLETGFVSQSFLINQKFNPNRTNYGLLIRPSIRFYLTCITTHWYRTGRKKPPLIYIEAQPFYKNVTGHYTGWIPMNCQDQNLGYEMYTDFIYHKQDAGFNLIGGIVKSFSKGNKVILFEAFTGIGVRYKTYRLENMPAKGCIPDDFQRIGGLLKGWFPNVQAGIRMGVGKR